MNRLTGNVWLVKSCTKQVGHLRVLAAREAQVEKTKQITEADITPSVAMLEPLRARSKDKLHVTRPCRQNRGAFMEYLKFGPTDIESTKDIRPGWRRELHELWERMVVMGRVEPRHVDHA